MRGLNALHAQVAGFGDPGFLVYGVLFGAVFLGVVGVLSLLGARDSVSRRLSGQAGEASDLAERAALRENPDTVFQTLIKSLEGRFSPTNEDELSKIRNRLIQAGFMSPNAVTIFYAIRVPVAILLPIAYLLFWPRAGDTAITKVMFFTAVAAYIGLMLPNFVLNKILQNRQDKMRNAFPDAIDLLVVCTEAGLGLDAAFQRVGAHIASAHPELSEQIAWISMEMRAGKPRAEALRGLANRTGVEEIQSFVTLLIQSDNLGVNISETLRVNSNEMRQKRTMKAEEKAHALPVKLSVPLVLFILPSMVTAVLLPGIISIIRNVMGPL